MSILVNIFTVMIVALIAFVTIDVATGNRDLATVACYLAGLIVYYTLRLEDRLR